MDLGALELLVGHSRDSEEARHNIAHMPCTGIVQNVLPRTNHYPDPMSGFSALMKRDTKDSLSLCVDIARR